ncbi:MAG TPA: phosphatase PAP2 family protein [Candidatus Poseidoniales archaeon]|nr:MAG TPA: phosphatase PAP2 family protein [Candidatus Poseidoniales archaeon]
MIPLAYNLTPEINDWFTRIDPFTNGMPSLHIAFPFSVWLCLMRYDQDKRWERYRKIVAIFILLTAFSIIYLGIHWFSDIIGGMVVAFLAVHLSEKSQFVWNYLDERTINSRISALLSNPNKSFAIIKNRIKQSSLKFKKPGSSETTALIIGLLFVVGATVTWDLTHQALPAKGVELPVEVKASGEWMVTLDNHSDGIRLIVHEISNLEN